uniref:Uncharacterized protein n=1 Tax=Oryza brachyantha TaxID=4533 RepID=A0A1V1H5V9_ORYBR|nr:hypothetical protein [Oryza brachyantha]
MMTEWLTTAHLEWIATAFTDFTRHNHCLGAVGETNTADFRRLIDGITEPLFYILVTFSVSG